MRLIDADALKEPLELQRASYARIGATERAKSYADCLWEIAQAPTIGGWISVKDRLPEIGKIVLFAVKDYTGAYISAQRGAYFPEDGWMKDTGWHISNTATVTHWMPLPEPPEEVSGDD